MHKVFVLGVPIDSCTKAEAVDILQQMLQREEQSHVMTPNSEMLVEAARNPKLLSVLQHTALNLPDSIGVVLMARMMGQKIAERVAGVDSVKGLCSSLTEESPVFLLGGAPGVAEEAAKMLCKTNPHIVVAGTYCGSPKPEDAAQIRASINASAPHLLLVAFGSPAQDLWINQYLPELPSVRVAIGVGGTLDFLAGRLRRAPIFLQRIGLEWFWRLCLEPKRLVRIIRATVVFPFLVLHSRLRGAVPQGPQTIPARPS